MQKHTTYSTSCDRTATTCCAKFQFVKSPIYESTISYGSLWVDLKQFDFSANTPVKMLDAETMLVGEATEAFTEAAPVAYAEP